MTVGNHEFDDGPEVLRGFIDAVDFPGADGERRHLGRAAARRRAQALDRDRGGRREDRPDRPDAADTAELASPGPNVDFSRPRRGGEARGREADGRGRRAHHRAQPSGYRRDQKLAAAVDGIDVIVGGHSHTLLANTIEGAAGPYPTWVRLARTAPHADRAGRRLRPLSRPAGRHLRRRRQWSPTPRASRCLMDASIAEDPALEGARSPSWPGRWRRSATRSSPRPPRRSTAPARPAGRRSARWATSSPTRSWTG